MEKPLAILFDLDGTLVDTAPDFVLAANALRKANKLDPLPAEIISPHVSNGSIAVTRICMNISEEHPKFALHRKQMLNYYATYLGKASSLYPKLNTLLTKLSNASIPWGVVTNKPLIYAQPLIEKLGLTKSCSVLICPEHVLHPKPDPEALLLAAHSLGVPAANCIYIGDHIRDIDASNAANMFSIGAGYGYIDTEQNINNWACDHFVGSSKELHDYITHKLCMT